eukprot:746291-Hanusia_phi.AAC.1
MRARSGGQRRGWSVGMEKRSRSECVIFKLFCVAAEFVQVWFRSAAGSWHNTQSQPCSTTSFLSVRFFPCSPTGLILHSRVAMELRYKQFCDFIAPTTGGPRPARLRLLLHPDI